MQTYACITSTVQEPSMYVLIIVLHACDMINVLVMHDTVCLHLLVHVHCS